MSLIKERARERFLYILPPSLSPPPQACRYRYTQQPVRDLQCNPYTTGQLRLACEVSFSSRDPGVQLQWVILPAGEDDDDDDQSVIVVDQSTFSSKYTVTPNIFSSLVRSEISVGSFQGADAGSYYCQVRFENGSLAMPSQRLDVFVEEVYESLRLGACSLQVQSVRDELCALVGEVGEGEPLPGARTTTTTAADDDDGNPGNGGGGGGGNDVDVVLWAVLGGVGVFIFLAVVLVFGAVMIHVCCVQGTSKNSCEYFKDCCEFCC